jgi:hypothetical protein
MVVLGLASQRLHNSGSSRTDSTLAAAEPIGGALRIASSDPSSCTTDPPATPSVITNLVQLVIDYTWLC